MDALIQGPSDTEYNNRLHLETDGVVIIDLQLPGGPLKDQGLKERLDRLREDIDRPFRMAQTRQALAASAGNPQTMAFSLGSWNLSKTKDGTFLQRYGLVSPHSEWFERKRAVLEAAALAQKIQLNGPSVQVNIPESDFHELWQELRKLDFAHFAGLQRDDFIFRPQTIRI